MDGQFFELHAVLDDDWKSQVVIPNSNATSFIVRARWSSSRTAIFPLEKLFSEPIRSQRQLSPAFEPRQAQKCAESPSITYCKRASSLRHFQHAQMAGIRSDAIHHLVSLDLRFVVLSNPLQRTPVTVSVVAGLHSILEQLVQNILHLAHE